MRTHATSYPKFHIIHCENELVEGKWYASAATWRIVGQYITSYDGPLGNRIHRFTGDGEQANSLLYYGGLVDVTEELTNEEESETEEFCCCLFSRKRHYM